MSVTEDGSFMEMAINNEATRKGIAMDRDSVFQCYEVIKTGLEGSKGRSNIFQNLMCFILKHLLE